jgi:hypothetical protein
MSAFKQKLIQKLSIPITTTRKFKDPYDTGSIIDVNGKSCLVLSQFRRGFFTIYTITEFKPGLFSRIRSAWKMLLFKHGVFTVVLNKETKPTHEEADKKDPQEVPAENILS